MSKTLAQIAVEFEKWDKIMWPIQRNATMSSDGFGHNVYSRAGRFTAYVQNQEAIEYYNEAKRLAVPGCGSCHGTGVLPTNEMGNPYMARCGCTYHAVPIIVDVEPRGEV